MFIPKNEINWYFKPNNFRPIDEAEINDNVSFFDSIGNIQYQALVVEKANSTIKIKCQDLTNAEYYVTVLCPDSIRDLDKRYKYEMKVYKEK